MALPRPNQAGRIWRDCVHANVHGMARRSSNEDRALRRAGRDAMGRASISLVGVACSK
ncbi:MAG: hypothetical protein CM1200mP2_57050 [Planctomycetaceae bacterium]|nr:MAG: hypothetical protein CM1200mP2_57050 [Planctomycetaceae bacterium]